jgi:hypothetical protein
MKAMLKEGRTEELRGLIARIENAGGEVGKELPAAINNAVDQTGRLKNALRAAADDFAKPVNEVISKMIKYAMGSRDKDGKKSGLGLTGGELLAGGAAIGLAGLLGLRMGKNLISRYRGTAGGIAEGKAIEAATGVTPVFVTNWPAGGVGAAAGGAAANAAGAILDRFGNPIRTTVAGGARAAGGLSGLAGLGSALGPALPLMAITGLVMALTHQIESYSKGSDLDREMIDAGHNEGYDAAAVLSAIQSSPERQPQGLQMRQTIEVKDGKVERVTTQTDSGLDVYAGAMGAFG